MCNEKNEHGAACTPKAYPWSFTVQSKRRRNRATVESTLVNAEVAKRPGRILELRFGHS